MPTVTQRLVLVPIGLEQADDLWRLHQDPWVAAWYGGAWSREEAVSFAVKCAEGWRRDGVSKWVAYERATGDLAGRGGLTRMPPEATATAKIGALLADPRWPTERLEVGWALREGYRGKGLATELGRAALAFAAGHLGASRVVSFTERHNWASRGVMEKLGLGFVGEIHHRGLVEGQIEEDDEAPFVVYATRAAETWSCLCETRPPSPR